MSNLKLLTVLTAIMALCSCVNDRLASGSTNCKTFDVGANVLDVVPDDSGPSSSDLVREIKNTGGITTIENLESVDMVVSYFPNSNTTPPIEKIIIPAGKESTKFAGAPGYGRIVIERKQDFFSERGDGADIKICFLQLN